MKNRDANLELSINLSHFYKTKSYIMSHEWCVQFGMKHEFLDIFNQTISVTNMLA